MLRLTLNIEIGAAASGLFKHCSNRLSNLNTAVPLRLSSNTALNLCKIIANQRTDNPAPNSAHNPQRFLRLFGPIGARKRPRLGHLLYKNSLASSIPCPPDQRIRSSMGKPAFNPNFLVVMRDF